MSKNIVKVVEAEVVESLEPMQLMATIQIVVPTPTESMHLMHKSMLGMHQTLLSHTNQLDTIIHRITDGIESIESLEMLYDIRAI